jgi:chloramphenicol-sensitive protein RarD
LNTLSAADRSRGTLLGVTAYLIWGFAALYWIQTDPVDSRDLLAHRALWSVPVVMLTLLIAGRLGSGLALLKQPRTVFIMACSAACSATNWGVFLWAVTHEHATEASLGYFLLPLLNVVLGLTLFGERLDGAQKIAVAFAIAAVCLQVWHLGQLPWVTLTLAMSFGCYGAIRKKVSVGSVEGLLLETLFMLPFALIWLVWRDWGGLGEHGLRVDLFLMGAGVITAVPLMTYVAAGRLLPLTALGLVFYIGPTAQLLVAVVFLGEPFDQVQLVAFSLVWTGLAIVTLDTFMAQKRRLPAG